MNSERGFTLLEMLVVLLIAGIALGLAYQVLGQYRRAYASVGASAMQVRAMRMTEAWFRESAQGLYPVDARAPTAPGLGLSETEPPFEGTSDGFVGTTLSPVLAGQGIPTLQRWAVEREGDQVVLTVREGERDLRIPLPLVRAARLWYYESDGERHDRWPPVKGQAAPLPAAVALELERADSAADVVVAAIRGPRALPRDLRYEAEEL